MSEFPTSLHMTVVFDKSSGIDRFFDHIFGFHLQTPVPVSPSS